MDLLNYITWTADPTLFKLGFLTIRWYSLAFAIGFLVGYKIEEIIFKREHLPMEWLDKLFMYVFIATIVGARLGHCLFYGWEYYSQHPLDILKVWEGGLASHGGTFGIMIAVLIYSRKVTCRNPLFTFDRLVVPVAFVAALIRLGNLMNHEIYGHATTQPWGFRFITNLHQWINGAAPIFTPPSHPTQLYEALIYLVTFGLIMYMYFIKKSQLRQGLIFGVFLLCIFLSRFFIEFIKNDQESFESDMLLNMGQILSIPFIVFAIYLIIRAYQLPKESIPKIEEIYYKKKI